MDVFVDGAADMEPDALAPLDLVLGAFHSKLRIREDQTERYLATLRNPSVHVLAHPKARMYGRRAGLEADWPRVFAEAARQGKAIELDATPARQDLDVELARIAEAEGVRWFSIGSDAHAAGELGFLPFGMATAALAGIPRERILNYRTAEEVIAWAAELASPLDLTANSGVAYGSRSRDRWSPRVPAVSHFPGRPVRARTPLVPPRPETSERPPRRPRGPRRLRLGGRNVTQASGRSSAALAFRAPLQGRLGTAEYLPNGAGVAGIVRRHDGSAQHRSGGGLPWRG